MNSNCKSANEKETSPCLRANSALKFQVPTWWDKERGKEGRDKKWYARKDRTPIRSQGTHGGHVEQSGEGQWLGSGWEVLVKREPKWQSLCGVWQHTCCISVSTSAWVTNWSSSSSCRRTCVSKRASFSRTTCCMELNWRHTPEKLHKLHSGGFHRISALPAYPPKMGTRHWQEAVL